MRFALWGSEEQGLIGSRYHVAQLSQPDRDRILGVFQNDMVATSWDPATRYWLLSLTGTANATTDAVTGAAQRLGYDTQISPVTLRGASDHQSFQEVGIASANFSWRGEASPALLEPPYHSPEDTIERKRQRRSPDREHGADRLRCLRPRLGRHLRRTQDVAASGVLHADADVEAAVRRDGVLAGAAVDRVGLRCAQDLVVTRAGVNRAPRMPSKRNRSSASVPLTSQRTLFGMSSSSQSATVPETMRRCG